MGPQVMADWNAALTDWLKPFVEKLGPQKAAADVPLVCRWPDWTRRAQEHQAVGDGAWRLIVMTGCIIISDGMWDAGPIEGELARVV